MTKPLLCTKCGHRNSEHYVRILDDPNGLMEDAKICKICPCINFDTSEESLRGVK